jgi:hypothetical protein
LGSEELSVGVRDVVERDDPYLKSYFYTVPAATKTGRHSLPKRKADLTRTTTAQKPHYKS